MKTKLFFIFKLLFVSGLVFGQIGIGTDNPQFPLDVVGAIRTSERLIVENEHPNILFKKSNAVDSEKLWRIGAPGGDNDTRLLFQAYYLGRPGASYLSFSRSDNFLTTIDAYGNGQKWLTINNEEKSFIIRDFTETDNTGNNSIFLVRNNKVGIRNGNPACALDVDGDIKSSGRFLTEGEHPNILFKKTNALSTESIWRIGVPAIATDTRLLVQAYNDGTPGSDYFAFNRDENSINSFTAYSGGQAWFKINNATKTLFVAEGSNLDLGSVITVKNGKVGINQTEPAADLHVDGPIIIGNSAETPAQVDSQCLHPGEIAFSNGVFYGCGPNDGQGSFQGTYEWIPLNND